MTVFMHKKETVEEKAARYAKMKQIPKGIEEPQKPHHGDPRHPLAANKHKPIKLMQDMTKEEIQHEESEKALWYEAWSMYKKWSKSRLMNWLNFHEDIGHRENIRYRLNIIRVNQSKFKKR